MVARRGAHELLMGVYEDRLFGPMILFGAGGTATEIIHDTAVALPPLDIELARDLMSQTRIFKLLEGYRDRPPADLAAIAEALVRVSQLVVDCPAVKELDINPLLADETGVIALDARIRIEPGEVEKDGPNPRLAIRPYPNQWEKWTATDDGDRIFIRPIRPADEHLYGAFLAKLSPEDIRFRFLAPRKEFSHKFIARFTQIDYARAMAFVALDKEQKELLGRGAARGRSRLCQARIRHHRAQRPQGQRHRLGADAPPHPLCREGGSARADGRRARRAISACSTCAGRSASRSRSMPRMLRSAR